MSVVLTIANTLSNEAHYQEVLSFEQTFVPWVWQNNSVSFRLWNISYEANQWAKPPV
jgi:hypothetical protein